VLVEQLTQLFIEAVIQSILNLNRLIIKTFEETRDQDQAKPWSPAIFSS